MHVELLCDTGDNYEMTHDEDLVIDCGYEEPANDEENMDANDEENMDVEGDQSVTKETSKRTIPNTVNIQTHNSLPNRNINEAFEGIPRAMEESRKEK